MREHIASQAELLGAIRLPMGAFAGIASTDVQTDILFLRKRHPGEAVSGAWLERVMVPDTRHPRCAQKYLQINAWYARNPGFCIGRVTESNGYEEVPTVVFEGDLEPALAERIEHRCCPAAQNQAAKPVALAAVRHRAGRARARPGSYRVHHGRVHRVEGAELVDLHDSLNATQRAARRGLCAIRDHARTLLDAQLAQDGDEGLDRLRTMLNGTTTATWRATDA